MKKLQIFILGLIFNFALFGQQTNIIETSEFRIIDSTGPTSVELFDSLFLNMDKSELSTGMLYERAPTLINHNLYNTIINRAPFMTEEHLISWSKKEIAFYNGASQYVEKVGSQELLQAIEELHGLITEDIQDLIENGNCHTSFSLVSELALEYEILTTINNFSTQVSLFLSK